MDNDGIVGVERLEKINGNLVVTSLKKKKFLPLVEPTIWNSTKDKRPSSLLTSSKYFTYAGEVYERISLNEDIYAPKSYEEVIFDKNRALWISIMKEEISSMHKNGVLSIVDMPKQ